MPTRSCSHSVARAGPALGGASWARLGSDGVWVPWLAGKGVDIAPLRPANCGFDVARPGYDGETGWSAHFCERFAGQALKSIAVRCIVPNGEPQDRIGECIVTRTGLEGSLIYALAAPLRDQIEPRCATRSKPRAARHSRST